MTISFLYNAWLESIYQLKVKLLTWMLDTITISESAVAFSVYRWPG